MYQPYEISLLSSRLDPGAIILWSQSIPALISFLTMVTWQDKTGAMYFFFPCSRINWAHWLQLVYSLRCYSAKPYFFIKIISNHLASILSQIMQCIALLDSFCFSYFVRLWLSLSSHHCLFVFCSCSFKWFSSVPWQLVS